MSDSLWLCGLKPTSLLCPWVSLGKNAGVGCHALLPGIFPTQGSNQHVLHFLHWRWNLYFWATKKAHRPCYIWSKGISCFVVVCLFVFSIGNGVAQRLRAGSWGTQILLHCLWKKDTVDSWLFLMLISTVRICFVKCFILWISNKKTWRYHLFQYDFNFE